MLSVKNYISSSFIKSNLKNEIKALIIEMGYFFPIDDAYSEYQKKLGVSIFELDQKSPFERRMFYEFSFPRVRTVDEDEISWCSFFRLKIQEEYCIIKIIDIASEVEPESTSKKGRNKKLCIKLCFLSIHEIEDEIQSILTNLKHKLNIIEGWKENIGSNSIFDELCRKFSYPIFTEDEFCTARSLNDNKLLNTLMMIKSSGGLLYRDFTIKTIKTEDIKKIHEKLVGLQLIKSEYVVLCKKTSEQINKAPRKESIAIMGEHGIRCSKCNRLIAEENIEEFLTVTDMGNKMIDGSHWMTLNLVESLLNFGISNQNILVNISEGPEEIDAIVSLGNSLLLFELKDSQFSLGHAYAFQSRIGVYQAGIGIIWATKGVAPEVKDHLNRVKPDAEIYYIESNEELIPKLAEIIEHVRWQMAESELKPLLYSGIIINNLPKGIIEDLKESDKKMKKALKKS